MGNWAKESREGGREGGREREVERMGERMERSRHGIFTSALVSMYVRFRKKLMDGSAETMVRENSSEQDVGDW